MEGFSAIFCAGGDDADNLKRSTVRGEESDGGDCGGQRAGCMKELRRGVRFSAKEPSDQDRNGKIDADDREVSRIGRE